ncbi:MAG: hypothetical protein HEQ35_23515 [Gloeotrichia echinulata IR180]
MLSNSKPAKNISLHRKPTVEGNTNNILLTLLLLLVLPIGGFTTFCSVLSLLTGSGDSYFPTSIPWIDNQAECQHTHRSWYNNKCWDDEQSPMF